MTAPSFQPTGPRTTVSLANRREEIEAVERQFLDLAGRLGYAETSRFALRLALEEAIINAFRHGHRDLPDKPIRLTWELTDERALIEVEDSGPGFTPEAVPDPTLDENLENPSGRGIMLMRAYMSDVRFNSRGNVVTMTFDRPTKESRRRSG